MKVALFYGFPFDVYQNLTWLQCREQMGIVLHKKNAMDLNMRKM